MPRVNKAQTVETQRTVVYEMVTVNPCMGESAITVADSKELLGWEEVKDGEPCSPEVSSLVGKKVNLRNNQRNRPIYKASLVALKQEHLMRRWRFNGEPIIVDKFGQIHNGQHCLISLILAGIEWETNRDKWIAHWPTEPTMEKLVVSGIDDSDETVNTIDTCKSRSLADAIYRSELFATMKPSDRRKCARVLDYAVRLLWYRTGRDLDAYAPKRTHAESLAFVSGHPKILDAVKHVCEENGSENRIGQFVPPGTAAGLLYLMGCSGSDGMKYREQEARTEENLSWDRWNDACNWWVQFAAEGDGVKIVRTVLSGLLAEGLVTAEIRQAIIVEAWLAHVGGEEITAETLVLEYDVDDDGNRRLAEVPSLGGIDLGDPQQADEDSIPMADPSLAEIQERAADIKNGKKSKVVEEPKPAKAPKVVLSPSKAGDAWAEGDVAWVFMADGEHYLGRLQAPYDTEAGEHRVMVEAADGEWDVSLEHLSLEKPAPKAKKSSTKPIAQKPKATGELTAGSTTWVIDKDASVEPWQGRVIEINEKLKVARVRVNQGFQGTGLVKTVPLTNLSQRQPR
jgi:hypothetical protein